MDLWLCYLFYNCKSIACSVEHYLFMGTNIKMGDCHVLISSGTRVFISEGFPKNLDWFMLAVSISHLRTLETSFVQFYEVLLADIQVLCRVLHSNPLSTWIMSLSTYSFICLGTWAEFCTVMVDMLGTECIFVILKVNVFVINFNLSLVS